MQNVFAFTKKYLVNLPSKKDEEKFLSLNDDLRKLILSLDTANLFLDINNEVARSGDNLGMGQVSKRHKELRENLLNLTKVIRGKI